MQGRSGPEDRTVAFYRAMASFQASGSYDKLVDRCGELMLQNVSAARTARAPRVFVCPREMESSVCCASGMTERDAPIGFTSDDPLRIPSFPNARRT